MTVTPQRVTAFSLTGTPEHIIDAATGRYFDLDTYSRMKHGDLTAITALGRKVAETLLAVRPDLATTPEEIVLPVAYMTVPPSCFFLASFVRDHLNAARRWNGMPPARIVRISKDSVTQTDYAAASQAEREAEMGRIRFSLDQSVHGAHVVLVDDVRVTGLAERTALATFLDQEPTSVVLAYVAVVDEGLAKSPHVESAMNHATVTSVLDMFPAIRRNDFALTIRFLKRVLGSPQETRSAFFAQCPTTLLHQMREGTEGSGDSFVAAHRSGYDDLTKEIDSRDH